MRPKSQLPKSVDLDISVQTKKGVDIAADPGESVLQTCYVLCESEGIAQGELLNSWQGERGGVGAERIAGSHVVEGYATARGYAGVESHRVGYVEYLPCEFQILPLRDPP